MRIKEPIYHPWSQDCATWEDDPEAITGVDEVRDPKTGQIRPGHTLNPAGGPVGAKDRFPRNSVQAMEELIAGRIMRNSEDQAGNPIKDEAGNQILKSAAEIMADAILDGMEGKLILSHNQHGDVIANPINAVKLYHDYMLRAQELALKAEAFKKKEKGATGGIRIVLPSVPRDLLLRPGQQPRGLRVLGQDPDTPLPDVPGCEGKGRAPAPE
jgi:hypothetical protein